MDASPCTSWCCRLSGYGVNKKTKKKLHVKGYGSIIKLNGDLQQSCLPGLTEKAGTIESNYVLFTCHSTIPGYSSFDWEVCCTVAGETFHLRDYVSGAVSCCGNDCLFGQGEAAATDHHDLHCLMKLNFTLLCLNKTFATESSIPQQCKPPCVPVPQNDSRESCLDRLAALLCPQPAADDPAESAIYSITDGGEVFLQIPMTTLRLTSDSQPKHSNSLKEKIARFETLQRIQYTCHSSKSCKPDLGLPLVCRKADGTVELIGMHCGREKDGHFKGITLTGILLLLQGVPVACFSTLKQKDARRIWLGKWGSYLLLPNLKSIDVKFALEIIHELVPHVKYQNPQDLPGIKETFFKLFGALFSHC